MTKTGYRDRESPDLIDFTIDPGGIREDDPALVIQLKRRIKGESYFVREVRIELDAADPYNLERLADRLTNLANNGLRSIARNLKAGS